MAAWVFVSRNSSWLGRLSPEQVTALPQAEHVGSNLISKLPRGIAVFLIRPPGTCFAVHTRLRQALGLSIAQARGGLSILVVKPAVDTRHRPLFWVEGGSSGAPPLKAP